jgi:hypothetical protein
MRHPIPLATIALALTLVAGGCGSDAPHTTTSHPQSTTTDAASRQATPAVLEQAVRRAIIEEHKLSVEVLWTNRVPANPPASGGPALANLRRSVAQRRKAGVRVRVLSEHFRILGVRLDPSYATATATVLDNERVQPTYPNGRPRGKPSASHEHVHLELHRVGDTERFLVWKVELLS